MLSKKLKVNRELFNLTQRQMAEVLNIERSTYAYYETGKSLPTIDTIVRIARIFNMSIDDLVDHQPTGVIDLVSDNTVAYKRRVEATRMSALSIPEQDLLLRIRQLPQTTQKEALAKCRELLQKYNDFSSF